MKCNQSRISGHRSRIERILSSKLSAKRKKIVSLSKHPITEKVPKFAPV